MITARVIAYNFLKSVLIDRKALDFSADKNWQELETRDRAFVRQLVLTTLRHTARFRALIPHLTNGRAVRPAPLEIAVLLGLTQFLILETDPHAAINETVDLIKEKTKRGFVNAVLRQAQREPVLYKTIATESEKEIPDFLYNEWQAAYGADDARQMATASLQPVPYTDLSFNSSAALQNFIHHYEGAIIQLDDLSLRLTGQGLDVPQLPLFQEGVWWVQDYAASLPAKLLNNIKDKTVLDLCAAPGGKTAQLAARGAHVTAVDIADKRLQRLADNMKRLNLSAHVNIIKADILQWDAPHPYDAVLLDAPCSATGTIRRHPDLLHLRTAKELKKLIYLQNQCLWRAAHWVKPQGHLVYAVCSLQRSEGAAQIDKFLNHHKNFERAPVPAEIPAAFHTKEGAIQIRPDSGQFEGGLDGFYTICLQKTA